MIAYEHQVHSMLLQQTVDQGIMNKFLMRSMSKDEEVCEPPLHLHLFHDQTVFTFLGLVKILLLLTMCQRYFTSLWNSELFFLVTTSNGHSGNAENMLSDRGIISKC